MSSSDSVIITNIKYKQAEAIKVLDSFLNSQGFLYPEQKLSLQCILLYASPGSLEEKVRTILYLLIRHYLTHSYDDDQGDKVAIFALMTKEFNAFFQKFKEAEVNATRTLDLLQFLATQCSGLNELDLQTRFNLQQLIKENQEPTQPKLSNQGGVIKGEGDDPSIQCDLKMELFDEENWLKKRIHESTSYSGKSRYKVILYALAETLSERRQELREQLTEDILVVCDMVGQMPLIIKVVPCQSNPTFIIAITFVEKRYKKFKKELKRINEARDRMQRLYTTINKGQLFRINGTTSSH